jgi:DNA-directed RNA polymerase subunit beta'|uniref:RNA polymerase b''-subunit n=1 Tax=Cryptomonas gyropyrenoidosa TaxID=233257 RepID=UPI0027A7BDE9|nr:RNA polymerase b''-subunit [Cryptomonas gyropyrenoidosa]WFQ82970.1 RNA polymerase b''-subunit [Cryptomonas gyropyrenoidosa]
MKEQYIFVPSKPKFINKIIDKKELKNLMAWSFNNFGAGKASYMADKLKEVGFHYATKAGISLSIEDLRVPPTKRKLINDTTKEIQYTEQKYGRGEITAIERFQKVIDTWNNASESLKNEVIKYFKETDPLNPVYIMAFSGARGNISQVKQLVGMRGLMSDPHGEIIDLPIKSNFREGLTVTEYVISCYGARKGLVDTALRTADSGYLTRRLVDVAQDIIIREVDCGTTRGIIVKDTIDNGRLLISLEHRLVGRSLFETLYIPDTSEIVAHINQDIDVITSKKIIQSGIKSVYVRSPLTCESSKSVCQFCYGWSLAYGSLVDLGEAVGIIAAQSIGEPGTQLTMRTFHTGGVFTGELAEQVRAPFRGVLRLPTSIKAKAIRTRHGNEALVLEETTKINIYDQKSNQSKLELKQGTTLFLSDNEQFEEMQVIGEVYAKGNMITERATKDLLSNIAGEIYFSDLPTETKIDRQGNITVSTSKAGLLWVLEGDIYNIPNNALLQVNQSDFIQKQGVLAITETLSDYGGIVRLNPSLQDEIQVVTASSLLENAYVTFNTTSNVLDTAYFLEFEGGQTFLLHCSPGNKVSNGHSIAELIDNSYTTITGGFIKYGNLETDTLINDKLDPELSQNSVLYWISEETHDINKDASLLLIHNGEIIQKNHEIIKGIYSSVGGLATIVEENGIVKEITIRPGYLIELKEHVGIGFPPQIFEPENEISKRLNIQNTSYLEEMMLNSKSYIFVQPVVKYVIHKNQICLKQNITKDEHTEIQLNVIQRILLKDGEKVRSCNPVNLLKTTLVVNIVSAITHLSADVEFLPLGLKDQCHLQLTIIENLSIKKDPFGELNKHNILNELTVSNGDRIVRGTVVAKTKLLCWNEGEVKKLHNNNKTVQNILVLTNSHKRIIPTWNKTLQISKGDLVKYGDQIAEGIRSSESGQIIDITSNNVTLRCGRPYLISPDAILQVNHLDLIQSGDILAILVFERSKTGDIVQGLPKIEEILEARKPKESCLLSQRPGQINFIYNSDDTCTVTINEMNGKITEYFLPSFVKFITGNGEYVVLAEQITDGAPNPHEILSIFFQFYRKSLNLYEAAKLSLQKVQIYLVNQVQFVYQSQGVDISDKHIEIIVRQMTSKVKVEDGGDTTLLPGELVELEQIENINKAMILTKGLQATYYPILLGITKSSLNTDSFISAASFQETTRVLTEAAIEGKTDWLRGLKENVIIGRLIPAGTGFNSYNETIKPISPEPDLKIQNYIDTTITPPKTSRELRLDDENHIQYSFTENQNIKP